MRLLGKALMGLIILNGALVAVGSVMLADDNQGFFSGAVGPLLMGALLDPSAMEDLLPGLGFAGDLNVGGSELLLLHGGGFAGSDPLRFGYLWSNGRWSLALSKNSKFDRAALSLGYGGLMLERLVSESGNMGFSLGAVLGGGEWGLQMSRTPLGSFEDLLLNPPVSLALHRSFWFVLPYVSTEIKILVLPACAWGPASGRRSALTIGGSLMGSRSREDPLRMQAFPSFKSCSFWEDRAIRESPLNLDRSEAPIGHGLRPQR